MKLLYSRLLNDFLSIITTFLLMAAPVAAIVYAAEPVSDHDNYIEEKVSNGTSDFLLKTEWFTNIVDKLKPDILDETLASTLTELKNHAQDYNKPK